MSRSAGFRIIVPGALRAWERGFENLPRSSVETAARHAEIATDLFFGKTQEFVHVLTGNLKYSGDSRVYVEGRLVVGEVEYGGEGVHYAQEEEDRGGEHAYLARGWEAAADDWDKVMPVTWREVTSGWR